MARAGEEIRTLTSTDTDAISEEHTSVTGTNYTKSGVPKRALNTDICNTSSNPVPVSGNFTVAAPGPILVSGHTVTATSGTFPPTPQADRAAISVRNLDAANSIYVVNSSGITLAAAGSAAWEIGPDETLNFDLDDTSSLFLVAPAATSVSIQILEIRGPI